MARRPTGQVIERMRNGRLRVVGIRFSAYGRRPYLSLPDGTTRKQAEMELENVLADVRRGIWQPPEPEPEVELQPDPTFHEFASEWFEGKRRELRPNTIAAYEWEITHLLLPFFARYRLSEITVAEVDQYRNTMLRERDRGRRLSSESINKSLTRLAQILEVALEYELIDRNPAVGKRRRLRVSRPNRSYLDGADQIAALLDAAGRLDAEARADRRGLGRRAILATLVLAGLRIGEALELRWRDVDLATGRLCIGRAKTDAGVREVELLPALRDELVARKAAIGRAAPDALVFSTSEGRPQNASNVRQRVLGRAVKRANEALAEDDLPPLPERLTPHSLRRTFASVLYALGCSPVEVMDQLGHTDPKLALRIYAKSMRRDDGEIERLRALAGVSHWAPMGTTGVDTAETDGASAGSTRAKDAYLQGNPAVGAAGIEPATSRV
jgi:integrase